jgi:putative oxidoreductase
MLLVQGLLTPVAQALITGTMVTAMRTAHKGKGPWISEGGWEYNAVLVAGVFAIAERGPGPISLDRALGSERCGLPWAIAGLAAGIAGSQVALTLSAGAEPAPSANGGDPAGVAAQAAEPQAGATA